MLTGSEIRRKFLDFFVQKGHREVHSSSLVPAHDPTLLFTNAGMNQFKDVFLGLEKRAYSRATTSQKVVRAGGKHNDLENVGFTNRHHTFFEMLGNFSFGDYFKKDAIGYAWELITSPEWFGISKDKLYVTIFKGENNVPRDSEAYDLWLGQGVPKERIHEFGSKDNFWQMGDTGPCGPCSEIHYDMGPTSSNHNHTDCAFGCDCGRYVEIWNLVFMQFDRDTGGKLMSLPKPSIDTGMGLERVAAVLQGVISNYDTDLFVPLIDSAAKLTGARNLRTMAEITASGLSQQGARRNNASLRIIADHGRAMTFLVSDGVLPANEGRGYVLRKIIRRAIHHGRLLGATEPFLFKMVYAVQDEMKDAYPELVETADRVARLVEAEETRFARTLATGLKRLEDLIRDVREERNKKLFHLIEGIDKRHGGSAWAALKQSWPNFDPGAVYENLIRIEPSAEPELTPLLSLQLPGAEPFKLYDTFGLPRDFIEDAARDAGMLFDAVGFDRAMGEQRERARASWKGAAKQAPGSAYHALAPTSFVGYQSLESADSEVVALVAQSKGVQELKRGESGEVFLDHTSFYAESGGQVGDRGWLYSEDRTATIADVSGSYYPIQGVRAHLVVAKQPIRVGDKVAAVVNPDLRASTMRNHTATHLLHAGLREVLGRHVKQAGSLVAPNHLRFDFSHFAGVEDEELVDIEDLINREVLGNERIEVIENVPIEVAVNEYKAMALFGEKYGDKVRVIRIGDFSTELCGGTHTAQTGEIGLIKILKESSVSSGVRRIEAVTGEGSLHHFRRDHELEGVVASFVSPALMQRKRKDGAPSDAEEPSSPAEALKGELEKKDAEIKRLQKELDHARMKSASSGVANLGEKVKEVKGIKVLAHRADNLERPQMRALVDQLRDKLGSGVVVVGSATNGSVSLIAGVTKDLTGRIQAGKVVGAVAERVGGKGGGRPDLAEAGGKDASALDSALAYVYSVVESLLG
jgi:alanyl-tRNA synthetase